MGAKPNPTQFYYTLIFSASPLSTLSSLVGLLTARYSPVRDLPVGFDDAPLLTEIATAGPKGLEMSSSGSQEAPPFWKALFCLALLELAGELGVCLPVASGPDGLDAPKRLRHRHSPV